MTKCRKYRMVYAVAAGSAGSVASYERESELKAADMTNGKRERSVLLRERDSLFRP